jgi:signal transduction histidine kinase
MDVMREGIWHNPEIGTLLAKSVLIMLILTAIMLVFTTFFWSTLHKAILMNNLACIGNLVVKHPELQDDIVPAFIHKAGPAELARGLAAARRFGYDARLPIAIDPLLFRYSGLSYWSILAFSLICLGMISGVTYQTFKRFYRQIRETAKAAEKIIEGDFHDTLPEGNEGDFAKLGHQFNEMAKRLRLTLEQLQDEKNFLKNIIFDISHQLKTPLASLRLFNELLVEEIPENTTLPKEFASKMTDQIERMEWLIKNLLLIAKIEAKTIEFQIHKQSLNCTVRDAIESLRPKWESKKILVGLISDEAEISLRHDRKWLGEAIGNIIKNSIEHTGEGGRVEIELVETAVMVRIIIRDNGVGIHPEDIPHVFERFFKGRNSPQGSGTGIGLTLAKSIVESHGGMIRAESEFVQAHCKKTEFSITFPKCII